MKAEEYVQIRLHDSGKLEICEGGSPLYDPRSVYSHYDGSNGKKWQFIVSKNNEVAIERAKKKMFSYLKKEINKEIIPLQKKLKLIEKFEKEHIR